ncbi:MAG: TIGR04076 family protein [Planctomycetes bacterium]|nr:TIGR04076 family protein [Planctomycetota bacterium]
MKRRSFIKNAVAASAGTLAASSPSKAAKSPKKGCKIKVLKCTVHNDLYQKVRNTNGRPCQVFKEGQEFILKSQYRKPEGFCDWAWADIRHFIQAVWHGDKDMVTCCTDGFRPVIFQLSRPD